MSALITDEPPHGLRVGRAHPLFVRRETVSLGLEAPLALLYASDLHLTANGDRIADKIVAAAGRERPDAVLLGGDLVEGKGGLGPLEAMVRALAAIAPVLAVEGNHDRFWGASAVRAAVQRGSGHWLVDAPVRVGGLRLVGSPGAITPGELHGLVGHDPAEFPSAVAAGARLVFAGHLHGGQCVLGERGGRLYPAAWFYRYNGLRFTEGDTTMLVSRGASDTLPLRYDCPTEVIACQLR